MTTVDMFDLRDIHRRVRQPKFRKFTYESKTSNGNEIQDRLLSFSLSVTKKCEENRNLSINYTLPQRNSWPWESPRGPGVLKFNNSLDKMKNPWSGCVILIQTRKILPSSDNQRPTVGANQNGIRIRYTKYTAKLSRDRTEEIRHPLEQLDDTTCNNFFLPDINQLFLHYLKNRTQSLYENKGKHAMLRAKCRWVEQANTQQNIFSTWEKRNDNKNFAQKMIMNPQQSMINRSSTKSKLISETCKYQ